MIYGDTFPESKLNFKPDFHIHIKISKEKLIEKRKEYIEKNPEKCEDVIIFLDKLDVFINKIIFSSYIKNRDNSKIDKWLNCDKNNLDEMYDQTFDYIIHNIQKYINEQDCEQETPQFIKSKNMSILNDNKKNKIKVNNDLPDLEKSYIVAPGIDENESVESDIDSEDNEPIYLGTTSGDKLIHY